LRVFVTGGNGFIGRSVVRLLTQRGDTIVAVVRDPGRSAELAALGTTLVAGDLSTIDGLEAAMTGADAVIHLAGMYRVGIRPEERPAMLDANVGATERVLDAALAARVRRIVYVSTVNVFGNTHGRVVDETYRRDVGRGFVSYYDETKFRAHEAAEARISRGAPVVIVQPGTVFGPTDHSGLGIQLEQAFKGRLPYRAVEDVGVTPIHVDDLAAGIVAALDRGRVGESYVLAGPAMRQAQALETAARVGGHRLPRLRVPSRLLRILAPVASRLPAGWAQRLGLPPNLAEVLSAAEGVTYWATSAKAERELGFRVRDLETGLRDAFGGG
jgi:nucleoside-diphosphate-sugar epimerase